METTEKNMEHGEHFNESIVNEVILEDMKKNRIDHMKYLPGMEVLEESDVMDQVISAMNAYDYDKYTEADVRRHLLMITVHQRIFRHCCLRLRCLFWRKSRRLRRKKPGNILGTVCICLPLFILQITVRITVFTADLTAIIRSAEQS